MATQGPPLLVVTAELASLGAITGSLLGWLRNDAGVVAAFVAFLWYALEIYESKTVQTWMRAHRHHRRRKRRARLVAKRTPAP